MILLSSLIFCAPSKSQILSPGFHTSSGLGCDAVETSTSGTIELPFPHGITFAGLTHLSTKFFVPAGPVSIVLYVYIGSQNYSGLVRFFYW